MQNFNSNTCIEKHVVEQLEGKIRLQEYGISIFESIRSKNALKKSIKKELISLNGKIAQTSDWIENGQVLKLYAEEIKQKKKVFQLQLKVIFEDEHLAFIDKPSGYPTNGNYFKTIENALPFNLKPSSEKDKSPYPQTVHRLDNPTSGVLLVSKTTSAKTLLSVLFEQKKIQKQYIAIAEGHLKITDGKFSSPIEGKPSLTRFRVENRFQKKNKDFSLVNLWPETGRTHQLRIHLSSEGHPIMGDKDYGSLEKHQHMLLHASSVHFIHPKTRESLTIQTEFPHKFVKFMNELK